MMYENIEDSGYEMPEIQPEQTAEYEDAEQPENETFNSQNTLRKRISKRNAITIILIAALIVASVLVVSGISDAGPSLSSITSSNGTVYYPLSKLISTYKENPINAYNMWVFFENEPLESLHKEFYDYRITLKKISGVTVVGYIEEGDIVDDFMSELTMKTKVSLRGKPSEIITKNGKIVELRIQIYDIKNVSTERSIGYPGY